MLFMLEIVIVFLSHLHSLCLGYFVFFVAIHDLHFLIMNILSFLLISTSLHLLCMIQGNLTITTMFCYLIMASHYCIRVYRSNRLTMHISPCDFSMTGRCPLKYLFRRWMAATLDILLEFQEIQVGNEHSYGW